MLFLAEIETIFSRDRNVDKVVNEGIGRAMKNVYYFATDYRLVKINDVIKYDSTMYEVVALDNADNGMVNITVQKLS